MRAYHKRKKNEKKKVKIYKENQNNWINKIKYEICNKETDLEIVLLYNNNKKNKILFQSTVRYAAFR